MMWAACCLAFLDFFTAASLLFPPRSGCDPEVHLSPKDVAIDNRAKPWMLKVIIKQSKTDPFTLSLGKMDSQLDALLPYMAVRGNQKDPLFIMPE